MTKMPAALIAAFAAAAACLAAPASAEPVTYEFLSPAEGVDSGRVAFLGNNSDVIGSRLAGLSGNTIDAADAAGDTIVLDVDEAARTLTFAEGAAIDLAPQGLGGPGVGGVGGDAPAIFSLDLFGGPTTGELAVRAFALGIEGGPFPVSPQGGVTFDAATFTIDLTIDVDLLTEAGEAIRERIELSVVPEVEVAGGQIDQLVIGQDLADRVSLGIVFDVPFSVTGADQSRLRFLAAPVAVPAIPEPAGLAALAVVGVSLRRRR